LLVLSLAVLALALVPAGGLAAKGGNSDNPNRGGGNGNGGGGTSSATLVPSCNPCVAGAMVYFSGSGYDPSQGVAQLDVAGAFTSTAVYADGTISFDWPYFGSAGTYDVKAYQRKGGRVVLKAQVTVVVE
jgi:hypothetical protein